MQKEEVGTQLSFSSEKQKEMCAHVTPGESSPQDLEPSTMPLLKVMQ